MPLSDAQEQRPKLEMRLDAAIQTLVPMVTHLQGGSAALAELKAAMLGLDVQRRLELELVGNGTATTMPSNLDPTL